IGAAATVAIGTALPNEIAAKILDFMARWSLEGDQVATELFINALCSVSWCQVWNLADPSGGVKYADMLTFSILATSTIALSLRPLFFKEGRIQIHSLDDEFVGESHVQTALLPRRRINRLLESSTEATGWFIVEQGIKAAAATPLIVLPAI